MKIPKIIFNDKILNRLSWFIRIGGISLWPWIILREKYQPIDQYSKQKLAKKIRHESIHIKQQEELLILFFYVWYIIEYIIKSIIYVSIRTGYEKISFEQEAKLNENNLDYLKTRKRYAWLRFLFR